MRTIINLLRWGDSVKNTFDFDFKAGEFRMKNGNPVVLTGVDALKMWIQKCLRTQLNRYSIYKGRQYGANIEDLVIGKSYNLDFAESELQREIEEALLQHDDIQSMINFTITNEKRGMNISFTLATTYGEITDGYSYEI